MDKIACAIILAGCVVGFCVMAIGILKDYRAKIIAETEERMQRDWLRLKRERASWRGLNEDMERDNIELRLENEALKRKIANMEALMARTKLKKM